MTAPVHVISAQLDLIDDALKSEALEELADMAWEPPMANEADIEEISLLLARIEESRHRLIEARAETESALAAIEMKRQVARRYNGTPGGSHK